MSTALVLIHTPRGFVVASDGLAKDDISKQEVTDLQKIFWFGRNRFVSYTFSGDVGLNCKGSHRIEFYFPKYLSTLAQTVTISSFETIRAYAEETAYRTYTEMKRKGSKNPISYPTTSFDETADDGISIASVYLVGYHNSREEMLEIRFSHRNQVLAEPSIKQAEPFSEWASMSREVNAHIRNEDELFRRFFHDGDTRQYHPEPLISGAVRRAKRYIEASGSKEAAGIDEKFTETVGGDTQIATITPNDGFQWVKGFEAKATRGVEPPVFLGI